MPAYEPGGAPGAIGRTCRRVMKSAPTPYARMLFRPASAWEGAACVCERWAREVEERGEGEVGVMSERGGGKKWGKRRTWEKSAYMGDSDTDCRRAKAVLDMGCMGG